MQPKQIKHVYPDEHVWVEAYYGWECVCGQFIPFGCEPWMPIEDEVRINKGEK